MRLIRREKKNVFRKPKIRQYPLFERTFQLPVHGDPALLKTAKLPGKKRDPARSAEIRLQNIAGQKDKIHVLRDSQFKDPCRTRPDRLKAFFSNGC